MDVWQLVLLILAQGLAVVGGVAAAYAALRADIREAMVRAAQAQEAAELAHGRIDATMHALEEAHRK